MESLGPTPVAEMVRMLVGPSQREFIVHKKLLCTSCEFFRCSLNTVDSAQSYPGSELPTEPGVHHAEILWLSEERPDTMELFVLWLYQRVSFRGLLEQMITSVALALEPAKRAKTLISRRALHRNLVRLHLFAAFIRLPALQDVAMDAVQDFYLRCDWDVSTSLVRHLYQDCSREQSFRLRKWAVAMLAWTLSNGGSDPLAYNKLFAEFPDLWEDYVKHVHRSVDSNVDVRVKNPQLRLPCNKLKSEERQFGFRQCSFHSHRSSVGEGRCPLSQGHPSVLGPGADMGFEMSPEPLSHRTRLDTIGPVIRAMPKSPEETRSF